jgi:phage tail-like protein
MNGTRPQYLLLDGVVGWRDASRSGLALTSPDADLELDPLPGRATLVGKDLDKPIPCPSALAYDGCGRLLLADTGRNRVVVLPLDAPSPKIIEAFGGYGRDPRSLAFPRALAIDRNGNLAVADSGNNRILLFSPPPYGLLEVIEDVTAATAIAFDAMGKLYAAGAAGVMLFDIAALPERGTRVGDLASATDLALAPDGTLAGVSGDSVYVMPPRGPWLPLEDTDAPASVTFGGSENLYIGTSRGLVFKYERAANGRYRLAGSGFSGVEGAIRKLLYIAGRGLFAIIREEADTPQHPCLWRIDPHGSFRLEGTFLTGALDSDIDRCAWHRVELIGSVPDATSVEVASLTSDEKRPVAADSPGWQPCLLSGGYDNPDCLVQSGPGQYLWLKITLRSNAQISPRIHAIKIHFPRLSYLQYLPAVYQEDPDSRLFLDRFLSLFQSSFDDFDRRIDDMWELFDALSVPEKFFNWLAGWLALPVDPTWAMEKKRAKLKGAFAAHQKRGTVAGIEQAIQDYGNVAGARVLEHFRIRRWPELASSAALCEGSRLWSRDFYQRLQVGANSQVGHFRIPDDPEPALEPLDWGANRFTVFFVADPYSWRDTQQAVQRAVEDAKPAYTEATLCPIFPRMRVGVQAMVGVDSVVGRVENLVLGNVSTLGYDAVLGCSKAESELRALGRRMDPGAGVDARLL